MLARPFGRTTDFSVGLFLHRDDSRLRIVAGKTKSSLPLSQIKRAPEIKSTNQRHQARLLSGNIATMVKFHWRNYIMTSAQKASARLDEKNLRNLP